MEADWRSPELERTAKISNMEGAFGQVHTTLAIPPSVFLTRFAVMLGATPMQFGILSAIGQLSQVFQVLGVGITRRMSSRRPVTVRLLTAARLFAPLFALLPFLVQRSIGMWLFLLLFFASAGLFAMGTNTWVAWISDLVPLEVRGRFFSRRSQHLLAAGLLAGYAAGAFLDLFDGNLSSPIRRLIPSVSGFFASGHLHYAFVVVFGVAAASGLISARILSRQPEHAKDVETESLAAILTGPLKDVNFRKLLLYGAWWMFTVGIASPFWQPFMIEKLGMSMVSIQVYATISTAASLVALRPWGILIDRFGNKTAMRFAIVLGAINPLVWVFARPESYWFVYFEAATSGIMWSGAGIVATNFVLAIAPDGKRQVYSAVFAAVSGIATMITMLLSGAFLPAPARVLGLQLQPEQVLFAITGLSRLTAQIPLSWVHEPRAQAMGAVLQYVRQYAKVRIAPVLRWRGPTGGSRDRR